MERCERCKQECHQIYEWHIDNGENGAIYVCASCMLKLTDKAPERDWDAERDRREAEGDN